VRYLQGSQFSYLRSFFLIVVAARIYKFAPIKASRFKRGDEDLSRCNIGSERNIINVAKTKKRILVLVNFLRGVSRAEIKNYIDFVEGYLRGYLLKSSGRAEKKRFNLKAGSIGNILTRHMRSTKLVTAKNSAISRTELSHQLLFIVVRYYSNNQNYPSSRKDARENQHVPSLCIILNFVKNRRFAVAIFYGIVSQFFLIVNYI